MSFFIFPKIIINAEFWFRSQVSTTKKSAKALKQTGTKILVRNIPFQAKQHEIQEIFEYAKRCAHSNKQNLTNRLIV